ncbi:hypothetical protein PR048_031537 [Dryococelus australis]|uniref:Uncharacterized protein n=1 Tax=Dryococelus australis TaxID=614101 RepID=A0ABQ9G9L1_9NEOP|nr:hypothetical protein PR048_031537 [Dryococelus australis]
MDGARTVNNLSGEEIATPTGPRDARIVWPVIRDPEPFSRTKIPHLFHRDVTGLLVNTVFDAWWRTLAQASTYTVTANNQCAVDISMFVHKAVQTIVRVTDPANSSALFTFSGNVLEAYTPFHVLLAYGWKCTVLKAYKYMRHLVFVWTRATPDVPESWCAYRFSGCRTTYRDTFVLGMNNMKVELEQGFSRARQILRLETWRTRSLSSRNCTSKTSRDGGVPSADMRLVFSLRHRGQETVFSVEETPDRQLQEEVDRLLGIGRDLENSRVQRSVGSTPLSCVKSCKYHCSLASNEEILERVDERRKLLKVIRKRKKNWMEHSFRREYLLTDAMEGIVCGKRLKGRRRYTFIDDIKGSGKYMDLKRLAEYRRAWRDTTRKPASGQNTNDDDDDDDELFACCISGRR